MIIGQRQNKTFSVNTLSVGTKKLSNCHGKVENILKGSLDSILSPSPSVKIQIMGGESLLDVFLKTKSLLTSASNVLPYHLK